jgi:hypothetical protein
VLTSLGIGEAVVTVMDERGAPTPVAWTRLRAPESRMDPCDPDVVTATVAASPRQATYGVPVDRESAREILAAKLEQGAAGARSPETAEPGEPAERPKQPKQQAKQQAKPTRAPRPAKPPKREPSVVEQVVTSSAFKDFMRTAAREVARGMFSTARRR